MWGHWKRTVKAFSLPPAHPVCKPQGSFPVRRLRRPQSLSMTVSMVLKCFLSGWNHLDSGSQRRSRNEWEELKLGISPRCMHAFQGDWQSNHFFISVKGYLSFGLIGSHKQCSEGFAKYMLLGGTFVIWKRASSTPKVQGALSAACLSRCFALRSVPFVHAGPVRGKLRPTVPPLRKQHHSGLMTLTFQVNLLVHIQIKI